MSMISLPSSPTPPWQWPWWRAQPNERMVLAWIVLLHITAVLGLVLYPLPGWPLFLAAVLLTWLGGIGTTVCYHRTLAHRSLRRHPIVHHVLIFNSESHLRSSVQPGEDSSRNVRWLAFWHLFQGENWHHNHHARPGSARLGWTPTQVDVGWWGPVILERLGLATKVRHPRNLEEAVAAMLRP